MENQSRKTYVERLAFHTSVHKSDSSVSAGLRTPQMSILILLNAFNGDLSPSFLFKFSFPPPFFSSFLPPLPISPPSLFLVLFFPPHFSSFLKISVVDSNSGQRSAIFSCRKPAVNLFESVAQEAKSRLWCRNLRNKQGN